MDEYAMIFCYFGFSLLLLIVTVVCVTTARKKFKKKMSNMVECYNSIRIGMTRQQVINLMGTEYNCSLLRDGVEKYEWKYKVDGNSYSSIAGVHHYKSGYTIKMAIKIKNGVVVEKLGNNLDLDKTTENAKNNYNKVTYGMSENEVLALLGGGYTVSELKNGDVRWEWKIRPTGTRYTIYYKYGSGSVSGGAEVQKIVVVFSNHSVIEKTCNFTN